MECRVTQLSPLHRLWLTETVRLREEHAGPLDDLEASRRARTGGGDLSTRLQNRALWLAERDGLLSAMQHWLQGARLALLVLAVLAVISGAGLAFAALGDGQNPVNVFWALGSLLGLNLILLLSWALGLLFAGEHGASLGRLWLWLSEKFARDAKAAQLAPALLLLLQRHRLNRWALGSLVNGLWLLAMLSALLMMLLLMATRRYGFIWETTILSPDVFVAVTRNLGALPGWLGFGVPTDEMIRVSTDTRYNSELLRQAWAVWLVGIVLFYGVIPRLLLATFCLWRWNHGRNALQLDLNLPGYNQLRERLMPSSERLGVNDLAPEQLQRAGRAHRLANRWRADCGHRTGRSTPLAAQTARHGQGRRHPRQPRIPAKAAGANDPLPAGPPGHCLRPAPVPGSRQPGADWRTGTQCRPDPHLAAAGTVRPGAGR